MARYDDYYGAVAQVEGIHWQIIEDGEAAYEYALNENADVFTIQTAFYDPTKITIEREDDQGRRIGTYGPLPTGATVNYASVSLLDTLYIEFNMARVPKPVRQAFAYVVNQQQLLVAFHSNRGEPAYHLTPPAIFPGGPDAYTQHAREAYPYGYNERQLDAARQVMTEAGYGPENRFVVRWTQFPDRAFFEMAQHLRGLLADVYVNLVPEQVPFDEILEQGPQGNLEVYLIGWLADWSAPDNFLQLLNPPQTDTSDPTATSWVNWSSRTGSAVEAATEAYERVLANPQPTEEAEQARNEAYLTMEEANWEDVAIIPLSHSIEERFWYDWVDIPLMGSLGSYRQQYNTVTIAERT